MPQTWKLWLRGDAELGVSARLNQWIEAMLSRKASLWSCQGARTKTDTGR